MAGTTQSKLRLGFTLIETIVTVGLLAVLAAFVVPSVMQKASAGDPVKVANDVTAINTGLESFQSDVKAGFPNQIHMLTDKPTIANHFIDSTTALTTSQVIVWNGPYLAATIQSTPQDSMATGYTAYIKNFLSRYDAVNNAAEHYVTTSPSPGTGGTFNATSTLYAAVTIVGLTQSQADAVNRIIDGPSDLDMTNGAFKGSNQTGRFRFDAPDASGTVVAYFLASPITP